MANAEASFRVVLEDETSGAARAAAASLDSLRSTIEADKRELAALQAAMRNLKGDSTASAGAIREMNDRIQAQRALVAANERRFLELGGSYRSVARDAAQASQASGGLLGRLQGAGGPVGEVVGRFNQLSGAMGGPFVVGAALAALAILKIGAAIVQASAELVIFGAKLADAARSQRLLDEALTGSATAGAAFSATIDAVSSRVAVGRDEVSKYGRELYSAGLRGSELEAAVEAAAMASSALGSEAASAFQSSAAEAAKAGKSVEGIAAAMKAKVGPVVRQQMLSLDVQAKKAREGIGKIFSDLKIDPVLEALSGVTSLLDTSTAAGQGLRAVVSGLIDPILAGVAVAKPFLIGLFKGAVIAALEFTVGVLKVKNAIAEAFGIESFKGLFTLENGVKAGSMALKALIALAAVFVYLAAAIVSPFVYIGLAIAAIGVAIGKLIVWAVDAYTAITSLGWSGVGDLIAAPFRAAGAWIGEVWGGIVATFSGAWATITAFEWMAIPNAIGAAISAAWTSVVGGLEGIVESFLGAWDSVVGIDWLGLGTAVIDGIVGGITAGIGRVADALKGVASSAMSAFKGALGISSPSKVFAEFGGYISEGTAQGIDAGAGEVDASVAAMVSPPSVDTVAAGAGAGGGGGARGPITVTINGVKGAEQLQDAGFFEKLADALEQAALGGAVSLDLGAAASA